MKNKIIIISLFLVVFMGNIFSKDSDYYELSNIQGNENIEEIYQASSISPELSQMLAISFEKNLHKYPCVLPSHSLNKLK